MDLKHKDDYFPKADREKLLVNLKELYEKVGLTVKDHDTDTLLHNLNELDDRQAFFAMVTLWRLIRNTVETVYPAFVLSGRPRFVIEGEVYGITKTPSLSDKEV